MKHYIDFHRDVSFEDLDYLLDVAVDLKAKTKAGIEHHLLKGKSLAIVLQPLGSQRVRHDRVTELN